MPRSSTGTKRSRPCRRFGFARLELLGSAARGVDFLEPMSNEDVLVTFAPGHEPVMAAFLDLRDALQEALGRRLDVVDRAAVAGSQNLVRRAARLG